MIPNLQRNLLRVVIERRRQSKRLRILTRQPPRGPLPRPAMMSLPATGRNLDIQPKGHQTAPRRRVRASRRRAEPREAGTPLHSAGRARCSRAVPAPGRFPRRLAPSPAVSDGPSRPWAARYHSLAALARLRNSPALVSSLGTPTPSL